MEEETSSTDLEEINTDDERATDISKWSDKERKKLQHMTEFHQEYQRVFGDRASLHTIIRKRISHMNPPNLHQYVKKKCKMQKLMKLQLNSSQILKAIELKDLNPYLSNLNPVKLTFSIYPVMMNYPLFQKNNSTKNVRLQ